VDRFSAVIHLVVHFEERTIFISLILTDLDVAAEKSCLLIPFYQDFFWLSINPNQTTTAKPK